MGGGAAILVVAEDIEAELSESSARSNEMKDREFQKCL